MEILLKWCVRSTKKNITTKKLYPLKNKLLTFIIKKVLDISVVVYGECTGDVYNVMPSLSQHCSVSVRKAAQGGGGAVYQIVPNSKQHWADIFFVLL